MAGVGDATGLPTSFKPPQEYETQGVAEGVGAGLEGIGEFLLGDGALKGLPLLKRAEAALKAEKALKLAAGESPLVQQILSLGLKVLRTGTASGAQSWLHDPSTASAATGAAFGVGGELTSEAASYGISKLIPRTLKAAQQEAAKDIAEATSRRQTAARAIGDIATRTTGDITKDILPRAEDFGTAANEIRETFNPTYDKLRAATKLPEGGNAFDVARNKLAAAKKVLFNPSSVEAAEAAQKVVDSNPVEALFAPDGPASKAGINADELKAASDGWRKASILEDLHGYIDKSFSEPAGVRNLSKATPEINPAKFVKAANKAIDTVGTPKLIDAMGSDNFHDLQQVRSAIGDLLEGEDYGKKLDQAAREYMKRAGASGAVSKVAGGPLTGGSVGVLAHLLGASNPVTAGVATTAGIIHWLYTHPDQGVEVLKLVQKSAPLGAQGAKQMVGPAITHIFDPDSGTVQAADQQ
jgi:hypothetical protein